MFVVQSNASKIARNRETRSEQIFNRTFQEQDLNSSLCVPPQGFAAPVGIPQNLTKTEYALKYGLPISAGKVNEQSCSHLMSEFNIPVDEKKQCTDPFMMWPPRNGIQCQPMAAREIGIQSRRLRNWTERELFVFKKIATQCDKCNFFYSLSN